VAAARAREGNATRLNVTRTLTKYFTRTLTGIVMWVVRRREAGPSRWMTVGGCLLATRGSQPPYGKVIIAGLVTRVAAPGVIAAG
jgi:hypothetical protein